VAEDLPPSDGPAGTADFEGLRLSYFLVPKHKVNCLAWLAALTRPERLNRAHEIVYLLFTGASKAFWSGRDTGERKFTVRIVTEKPETRLSVRTRYDRSDSSLYGA